MRRFRLFIFFIFFTVLFIIVGGNTNTIYGAGKCTAPQGSDAAKQGINYNEGATICIKDSNGITYSKLTCSNPSPGRYIFIRKGTQDEYSCQACTDGDLSNPDVQVASCTPVTTTFCNHPGIGNTSQFKVGARICFPDAIGAHEFIKECTFDGSWKDIESCLPAECTDSQTPPDSSATCINGGTPAPTPAPTSAPPPGCQKNPLIGQFDPQPGANCGLTASAAAGLGYTGDQLTRALQCCYPLAKSFGEPSLSCNFEDVGILENATEYIDKFLAGVINRAPFWGYDENDPGVLFNVRQLKDSLGGPSCMYNSVPIGGPPGTPGCSCEPVALVTGLDGLCKNVSSSEQSDCVACVSDANVGIWTGLGCVRIGDENSFVQNMLGIGVSLGGGLSLICIIYASLMLQQSQGNPEKLKKSRELITSCIMGLLLIVFSIFILRLIGYTILRIPGFS